MSNSFIYPNNFLFNFFIQTQAYKLGVMIFCLVQFLSKKITKTGSNRPVSVRLFGKKPVQAGLARFFPVWLSFFSGFFVRVRFGFFGSKLIKPNWSVFSKFQSV
jgi:hypothetical protein